MKKYILLADDECKEERDCKQVVEEKKDVAKKVFNMKERSILIQPIQSTPIHPSLVIPWGWLKEGQ